VLFVILGNYLPNVRPNYFIGIRTPWTLENPQTWRATHRVGGRLMFFGALVLLVLQLFVSASASGILMVAFACYSWSGHFFILGIISELIARRVKQSELPTQLLVRKRVRV
jgi:hypothetical protein